MVLIDTRSSRAVVMLGKAGADSRVPQCDASLRLKKRGDARSRT